MLVIQIQPCKSTDFVATMKTDYVKLSNNDIKVDEIP